MNMKVYIVVITVLATLACCALAKSSSKSGSGSKSGSCKKSDKSCKSCFNNCYSWSNTTENNELTAAIIHVGIKGYVHEEDAERKIPAMPSNECSGSGSKCEHKCKVAKVAYRSEKLGVEATLNIHSCGKCDSAEEDIPWEKTPTAHEALSKLTAAEMKVEFTCKSCSVRSSLIVVLFGVLLTLKAAF